ncbi:hypothetical protein [Herbidospora yilanensis]|uniref:hypothetical protein n=1 Tax=Herbidospora yilanensis TaxID=354426 RepID=UPI0007825245|nr:hypothetical protein [Herbidospora yilanensis]
MRRRSAVAAVFTVVLFAAPASAAAGGPVTTLTPYGGQATYGQGVLDVWDTEADGRAVRTYVGVGGVGQGYDENTGGAGTVVRHYLKAADVTLQTCRQRGSFVSDCGAVGG